MWSCVFVCLWCVYVCVCMCMCVCVFRAEGILNRGNVDAFALEESQNLSIFFATNNSITIMLKKALEEVCVAVL